MPLQAPDMSSPTTQPPSDADAAVGRQIRSLRKARRLSLQELADRTGLSIGFLSQIERGLSSPSLRVLTAVAQAFDLTLAALFAPHAGSNTDPVVVRGESRASLGLWRSGISKELLTPPGGRLALYLVHIAPGGTTGEESYSHGGEEGGLVLTGALSLTVENQTWELQPGDSFRFVSSRPHRFGNPGNIPTQVVWINMADAPA